MITLSNVTRRFGEKTVLSNLSFTFPDKGIFALMGPSGSGKTTLLRLLAGLDKPDGGQIESTHQKIAVAFQEHRLLPWLNCLDNLKLVLPKDKISLDLAAQWLEALELSDAATLYPKALSGGMKQRLSLARALCYGGDLLLLDEPFSALDEGLKERIIPLIREVGREALTVVITHDRDEAEALGATILSAVGDPITALEPIA
ncbi:MAG: ATP-binding cassette domain-containing protein [Clostridia bacterium]|nr:ATP-binding cassette domain-containing protein [Clostridia bacterium]